MGHQSSSVRSVSHVLFGFFPRLIWLRVNRLVFPNNAMGFIKPKKGRKVNQDCVPICQQTVRCALSTHLQYQMASFIVMIESQQALWWFYNGGNRHLEAKGGYFTEP